MDELKPDPIKQYPIICDYCKKVIGYYLEPVPAELPKFPVCLRCEPLVGASA